jgi:hypothetical protein
MYVSLLQRTFFNGLEMCIYYPVRAGMGHYKGHKVIILFSYDNNLMFIPKA